MKTAASDAEKPRNIQQKVDASQVRRRSLEAFSRIRFSANETQVRRSQEVSHSTQQKVVAAVRLSQEQPSDEDEISQNSTARGDGHSAAVQEKDTAHVKRLAHEAKRDMKLKYRTVVLVVPSRLPRRDRVSHSGVEDIS